MEVWGAEGWKSTGRSQASDLLAASASGKSFGMIVDGLSLGTQKKLLGGDGHASTSAELQIGCANREARKLGVISFARIGGHKECPKMGRNGIRFAGHGGQWRMSADGVG